MFSSRISAVLLLVLTEFGSVLQVLSGLLTQGPRAPAMLCMNLNLGVSENRGPQYSTLNSRILTMRTPTNCRKLPSRGLSNE